MGRAVAAQGDGARGKSRIQAVMLEEVRGYTKPWTGGVLRSLGYVPVGNCRALTPNRLGRPASLLHMGLSNNPTIIAAYVRVIEEHAHDIVDLADDIAVMGQLLPIAIRQTGNKRVIVTDGWKRLAAVLLLHARSKLAKRRRESSRVYPASVLASDADFSQETLYLQSCRIAANARPLTQIQEGFLYHEMLKKINPETGHTYTGKEVATIFDEHYSTFRNREALWRPYDPSVQKGLTDEERRRVAMGQMLATFASRKSLGEKHYSRTGLPKRVRRSPLPIMEIQRKFDETSPSNVERRRALAECMGLTLEQASHESDERIASEDLETLEEPPSGPNEAA